MIGKCAIYSRISTLDQNTDNQINKLKFHKGETKKYLENSL